MTLKTFTQKFLADGKVKITFDFNRPGISTPFHEEYLFKIEDGKYVCYENKVKGFESTSLYHLYFIYRKIIKQFNAKRRKGNYKKYKELVR